VPTAPCPGSSTGSTDATGATADLVDVLLILATVLVVYFGIAGFLFIVSPRRFDWPTLSGVRVAAVYWLVLVVYLTGAWSSTGRSIGKQLMGLRVERRGGDPLGIARALVRAILSAACPVGLLWCVVDRRSASVQDLIVGSTVVYDWRARSPRGDGPVRSVARGTAAADS
jgi:uncharacterized RDD family membrane protein YckC